MFALTMASSAASEQQSVRELVLVQQGNGPTTRIYTIARAPLAAAARAAATRHLPRARGTLTHICVRCMRVRACVARPAPLGTRAEPVPALAVPAVLLHVLVLLGIHVVLLGMLMQTWNHRS